MSEQVMKSSNQLNRLILESEEYQKYCLYKKELSKMPELKERVHEFRRKNFEIQFQENLDDKEAADKLAQEYKDVLENAIAASYLNTELSFCRMMQRVSKNMCRNIELEIDFL